MFDKPQASQVLGLEMDAFSLKGVALGLMRGKPKLETAFDFPIDRPQSLGAEVKPLYTEAQQRQLDSLLQNHLIVTSINSQDVLVRTLEIKVNKAKDIDAVLAFQAEPLLPYPTDNALLDKILLSKEGADTKLSLFSVRKDYLAQHLQQWHALHIEPEVVSAAPHALALFAKYFAPTENLCYVLHLDWNQSLCALVDQGKLIAAQTSTKGINSLLDVLIQEQGPDINAARQQLNDSQFMAAYDSPAFKNALDALRVSIMRPIYALAKQIKTQEVSHILVTGPGAAVPELAATVCRSLNKTLMPLDDAPAFGMSAPELQKYALPIGEALSALPTNMEQINFRQQEFIFPAPWKRLKKPIITYIALCLALTLALILFGHAYLHYQEGNIRQQYLDLLSGMNRSYTQFEGEFTSKTLQPQELATGETLSPADLTPADINSRLQYLEKGILAIPQIYPLQPNVPLVSDVLAWLSTHPSFAAKSQESQENTDSADNNALLPSLKIESLHYAMVKRPEPTKKQEKYQVKIELEFSSPTPKMAREFHDALIAPNDLVDAKAEIKWNSNKDRYRTSFYLKDKTIYSQP